MMKIMIVFVLCALATAALYVLLGWPSAMPGGEHNLGRNCAARTVGEPTMSLTIYHHPDGGDYVIVADHGISMKMDDGRWEPAVLYQRVVRGATGKWQYEGRNQFVVAKEQWAERFTATEETTAYRRS